MHGNMNIVIMCIEKKIYLPLCFHAYTLIDMIISNLQEI